jgi:hypothetical protein
VTATDNAASATAGGPSAAQRSWLRIGFAAGLVGAAGALVAAVAGGITEPTGIATVAAVVSTVVAYGLAPLLITVAMRQGTLSSWWAVAAALLAAVLWSVAGLLFAVPALLPTTTTTLIDAIVSSAPSASALWILVASVEVIRAGMHRWSLVFVAAFVAVLIIGSVLIELSGFDIRKVLVPLGWAVWMVDASRALRSRLSPVVQRASPAAVEPPCANCGAPRRKDRLAFCSDCGLPYGVSKTGQVS